MTISVASVERTCVITELHYKIIVCRNYVPFNTFRIGKSNIKIFFYVFFKHAL